MNSTRDLVSNLYILAGIPGCGKSTWARNFFPPHLIVSSDAIREELWPGEEYDYNRNGQVFEEFHARIGRHLSWYHPERVAVADATSLTADSREKLRNVALHHGAASHLVFFNNPGQAVARNALRTGGALVPPEAMEMMLKRFGDTQVSLSGEPYDSVTIIEETL